MAHRFNSEIKHHCDDFRPLRALLRRIGAQHEGVVRQTDTFFALPTPGARLKHRSQGGVSQLILYTDCYADGLRFVDVHVLDVEHAVLGLLQRALGTTAVVRKTHERWRKGTAWFRLDRVNGIGMVFEVVVPARTPGAGEQAVRRYRALFAPHLGEEIRASNEDLVGCDSFERGRLRGKERA